MPGGFKIPEGKGKIGLPPPTGFRSPEGTIVRPPINGGVASSYNDKIARKICIRLMEGETLKQITDDARMPAMRTVIKWLAEPKFDAFREMYYYARRVYAELLMDEIIEISDDVSDDWTKTFDKKGNHNGWKPNHEHVQRCRLRIDTRKYLAAKLIPRIYGEKLEVEHGVTGDLKELLQGASNHDKGLPPPINGEYEDIG